MPVHIISIFQLNRSIVCIVYENGSIVHYNNDREEGTISKHQLTLPFSLVAKVFAEPKLGLVCLESPTGK